MNFIKNNRLIETFKSTIVAFLSLCLVFFIANGAAAFQNDGTVRVGIIETLTGGAAPYGVAGAIGI